MPRRYTYRNQWISPRKTLPLPSPDAYGPDRTGIGPGDEAPPKTESGAFVMLGTRRVSVATRTFGVLIAASPLPSLDEFEGGISRAHLVERFHHRLARRSNASPGPQDRRTPKQRRLQREQ